MVEHDENREKDVQTLCRVILEDPIEHYESDYRDSYDCRYCCGTIPTIKVKEAGSKVTIAYLIQHEPECPYLIAKDLSMKGERK